MYEPAQDVATSDTPQIGADQAKVFAAFHCFGVMAAMRVSQCRGGVTGSPVSKNPSGVSSTFSVPG